ncbi:hybrid sensor histidine kinase/response regulator [Piscinibacter defluvii]|uniref:hybrid sensor histidine kinase/response regulator n=1 Tax=Piscinibacter defluvii TaxID=1796922 RepID=UPI000FDE467A|nr:PAS domain S-box protein [Piscinibacter defluvii]
MDRAAILIVEDEAIVALDLKLSLEELGYEVTGVASSGEQALRAFDQQPPQLVLMDVRLQGAMDGIATAEAIRRRLPVPLIFLTSHSDDDTVQRAARTAPYGYLTKPYQIRELRAGIEVALTKSRMERQLREADRWFAHTLHCVSDGVVVTDPAARIRFLNPAAEALTGWAHEDAVGRDVGEIVRMRSGGPDPGPDPDAARLVSDVLREGRPAPVTHARSLLTRTGEDRIVDEAAGPVDDDEGRRLGAVLVLRDAAPRVAHEAQLRASEARFRNAFDNAPLGMALVSFAGEFIQVNDALCKLLGLARDELRGLSHTGVTHPEDRAHEVQRLHELAGSSTGVVQFEKRYRRPAEAAPVWTLVSVSRLHDDDRASCYLYQVHDLTEQKQAAEHLAALAEERMHREASEMAAAAKSEFLSRVSHEMRTPLNAVMGFAQLLELQQGRPASADVGMYAKQIHTAGKHLLELVTDLLDLNRAAQGQLQLEPAPVALSTAVDEVLVLLRGQAAVQGIGLEARVPALRVMADARRLRQVLLNIGSNAIKYNRTGGVVRWDATESHGRVELRIEDEGIGMTPEQLDRLFQPFDRLGAERTTIPGTGLGLVISRSLVEEMGGTLTVRSVSRSGTTVTVSLPRADEVQPA